MRLTILEGSTFCICNEIGDLDGFTSGLFADDTRFLSRLKLRVNGKRPLLLSSGKVEYYSAAFYLRNPVVDGLPQDSLSIARERFVGEGMQDHLLVSNVGGVPLSFELELEVATDFADIISVKEHDFSLGNPLTRAALARACRGALRRRLRTSSSWRNPAAARRRRCCSPGRARSMAHTCASGSS